MTYPVTTVGLELITPEKAKEYFACNIENNRPINSLRVSTYANDILSGNWSNNAETIKFDRNGKLIDGQHRLKAIIKSERSVYMWVARGVDENALKTVDVGGVRNHWQIMKMSQPANATFLKRNVLSIANAFFRASGCYKVSQFQIEKWLASNEDTIDWAFRTISNFGHVPTVYGVIALIARVNDVPDAEIRGFVRGAVYSDFAADKQPSSLKFCVMFEKDRKTSNHHETRADKIEFGLKCLYSYVNNMRNITSLSNLYRYSMNDDYRVVKG